MTSFPALPRMPSRMARPSSRLDSVVTLAASRPNPPISVPMRNAMLVDRVARLTTLAIGVGRRVGPGGLVNSRNGGAKSRWAKSSRPSSSVDSIASMLAATEWSVSTAISSPLRVKGKGGGGRVGVLGEHHEAAAGPNIGLLVKVDSRHGAMGRRWRRSKVKGGVLLA